MSRVGKKPIQIPQDVKVKIDNDTIYVESKKGKLSYKFLPQVEVKQEGNEIVITRKGEDRFSRSIHGTTRSLIANMVEGLSKGFEKKLEIVGTGYRAQVQGNKLVLNLGYSHPIEYVPPKDISIAVERNTITVSGYDKQKVGQVAAEIRAFRKPEPYKGKGIKYADEVVRRKVGKIGA